MSLHYSISHEMIYDLTFREVGSSTFYRNREIVHNCQIFYDASASCANLYIYYIRKYSTKKGFAISIFRR